MARTRYGIATVYDVYVFAMNNFEGHNESSRGGLIYASLQTCKSPLYEEIKNYAINGSAVVHWAKQRVVTMNDVTELFTEMKFCVNPQLNIGITSINSSVLPPKSNQCFRYDQLEKQNKNISIDPTTLTLKTSYKQQPGAITVIPKITVTSIEPFTMTYSGDKICPLDTSQQYPPGVYKIVLDVTDNETDFEKNGDIVFHAMKNGGRVSCVWSQPPAFNVSPTEFSFGNIALDKIITVTSNENWTVTSNIQTSNMILHPTSGNSGKTEVSFNPGFNSSSQSRSGTLKFTTNSGKTKLVNWTQKGQNVATSVGLSCTPKPIPSGSTIDYSVHIDNSLKRSGTITGNGSSSFFNLYSSSVDYNGSRYNVSLFPKNVTISPTAFSGTIDSSGTIMCNVMVN